MKHAYLLMAAIALVALPGCGNSASSYCDDVCDCTGCNDSEHDECIDTIEDAERTAENEGCEDQWDDAFDCANDEFECRDGRVDDDGCGSESDALRRCLSPL